MEYCWPLQVGAVRVVMEENRRISVLLIVTVLTFTLLTIPLHVSLSVAVARHQLHLSRVITSPAYMLSVLNYAVNFPLYCLSARNFRQQFLLMIGIKPQAVVPINPPQVPAVSAPTQGTSAPTQENGPVDRGS